jgi:hypothetical protein
MRRAALRANEEAEEEEEAEAAAAAAAAAACDGDGEGGEESFAAALKAAGEAHEAVLALQVGITTYYGATYYGAAYYGATYYGAAYYGATYYGAAYYGATYYGATYYGAAYYGATYYGCTRYSLPTTHCSPPRCRRSALATYEYYTPEYASLRTPTPSPNPNQAECDAKLLALEGMATMIEASGRAEIRGCAAELPLPLHAGVAGGDNERIDADCVLVSFRYCYTALVPP